MLSPTLESLWEGEEVIKDLGRKDLGGFDLGCVTLLRVDLGGLSSTSIPPTTSNQHILRDRFSPKQIGWGRFRSQYTENRFFRQIWDKTGQSRTLLYRLLHSATGLSTGSAAIQSRIQVMSAADSSVIAAWSFLHFFFEAVRWLDSMIER